MLTPVRIEAQGMSTARPVRAHATVGVSGQLSLCGRSGVVARMGTRSWLRRTQRRSFQFKLGRTGPHTGDELAVTHLNVHAVGPGLECSPTYRALEVVALQGLNLPRSQHVYVCSEHFSCPSPAERFRQ